MLSEIDRLKERVSRLEYRESQIIALLDARRAPLSHFVLETDLNDNQIAGLVAVMDAAHQTLTAGTLLAAIDFENSLRPHIPANQMPSGLTYSFIQGLLLTFDETGQWPKVVDHFRREWNVNQRKTP